MGAKRRRKKNVGWAAAKAAAAASEGNQKLLTQNEGLVEANSLNYVLLSIGGEVGVDKNGNYKGSDNVGGGCKRVIIRIPHCVTVILCTALFIVYL